MVQGRAVLHHQAGGREFDASSGYLLTALAPKHKLRALDLTVNVEVPCEIGMPEVRR